MNLRNNNKNEKFSYVKVGIMSFCVIAAIIIFFFIIFKIDLILSFLSTIFQILQPIIVGAVIAFLINPIVKFLKKHIFLFLNKIFKKHDKFQKFSNYSAIIISLLLFILIISVFFYMIIPEFVNTITNVISVLPGQIKAFSKWLIGIIENNSAASDIVNRIISALDNWFQNNFLVNATTYATYLATGVIDVVNFIFDFLIGIVIAFYLLAGKQTLKFQFKKILYAIFKPKTTQQIISTLRKTDSIFSGFINGKLINALIIGILCFIGCSVMKIPYVMLISVVVAVTDMIPVLGPYIGAVPCALLILLNSPIKCLYFIIFIIILQVFDGNIIGPRILGESTGISPFWVMVAILLGGGLFGIIGMLIGVPVFAVIYYLLKTVINNALLRKKLPTNPSAYTVTNELNRIISEGDNDEQKFTDKAEQ